MEKNFTTGSVLKGIIFFSLPYPLLVLQTLYGMATLLLLDSFQMFIKQLLYLLAHSLCIFFW